jgi:WD40 repeat protein
MILTGGQAGILFDAVSGRALHQHRSPLNCAAVISGDRAIVGTYTGEGLVFRMCNGALELEQTVELHENAIKGLACSNGQIFSVCATGAAAFHSASSLRPERAIPGAHDKIANGCVALPGGFASVSRDLRLRIWSGSSARVFTTPLTHSIKCIAASESGRFLALGAYDGFVAIFDVAAERWARTARPTAAGISSLCADGEAFLASSYDGNIYRTEPSLPICE